MSVYVCNVDPNAQGVVGNVDKALHLGRVIEAITTYTNIVCESGNAQLGNDLQLHVNNLRGEYAALVANAAPQQAAPGHAAENALPMPAYNWQTGQTRNAAAPAPAHAGGEALSLPVYSW